MPGFILMRSMVSSTCEVLSGSVKRACEFWPGLGLGGKKEKGKSDSPFAELGVVACPAWRVDGKRSKGAVADVPEALPSPQKMCQVLPNVLYGPSWKQGNVSIPLAPPLARSFWRRSNVGVKSRSLRLPSPINVHAYTTLTQARVQVRPWWRARFRS